MGLWDRLFGEMHVPGADGVRILDVPTAMNLRELGGYQTPDGPTQAHRFLRSGSTRTLSRKDRAFLAVVKDYDPETKLARCEQFNKMSVGDTANLLSPGTTGRDIVITELFDAQGEPIADTKHPRMEFLMRVDEAKAGDILRGR